MADIRTLIDEYLKKAKLMQLATASSGQPWVCSVWFVHDKDLNIYWFSSITRRHSKEVEKNNMVAAAIALPHEPSDVPVAVQLQGIAEKLSSQKDVDFAIDLYSQKIFPVETIERLMNDERKPHMFYKITPSQFVLFDGVHFGDEWRQEYNLK